MTRNRQGPRAEPRPLRFDGAAIGVLLLILVVGGTSPTRTQAQPTPAATPTFDATAPPAPPTPETPLDISGTWDVTRSWFRNCPGACDWPVIRGTTWQISQTGSEFTVDRGPRGTIDGYIVHLTGIESDGFTRFDFYYSSLSLSPDGTTITGQFSGSETIQNPCGLANPIVTCFAQAGYFFAVRRSSPPPSHYPTATPTPSPSPTETATLSTPTPTVTPTMPPTQMASSTATPTRQPDDADHIHRRYLPLFVRLPSG
jgi:hypothetical protein